MAQLKAGSLSAFRLAEIDKLPLLAARIPAKMNGVVPHNVLAAKASRLRAIQVDEMRALCVISDTRIDLDGGTDPEHIALSPCERFKQLNEAQRDLIAIELRNQIMLAYREDCIALHAAAG